MEVGSNTNFFFCCILGKIKDLDQGKQRIECPMSGYYSKQEVGDLGEKEEGGLETLVRVPARSLAFGC